MHHSHDVSGVDNQTLLDCLPLQYEDSELVILLNRLCKVHGYGRVPQFAAMIEDIWRNPEKIAEYKKKQQDHLAFIKHCEGR